MPMMTRLSVFVLLLVLTPVLGIAQTTGLRMLVEPAEITLDVGDSLQVQARVVDANGMAQDVRLQYLSRSRQKLRAVSDGMITALRPGEITLIVRTVGTAAERIQVEIPVVVRSPALESISFMEMPTRLYEYTQITPQFEATDVTGAERVLDEVMLTSTQPQRASVDAFGHVVAHEPGEVMLVAEVEGVRAEHMLTVVPNPVVRLELRGGADEARTGDVMTFRGVAFDANDQRVADAPFTYAVQAHPDDDLGNPAVGQIDQQGRFVAESPGVYTIIATSGRLATRFTMRIEARNVATEMELIGQGLVANVHTSDLWVWEGVDGRDYAITGTWGANGEAYFWDVTDPATIIPTDTITVDARTVNDVKVSEDGEVCIISREGASNRRNGIVILDCTDPYNVAIITEYTDELTGGVHNLFIYEDHVYALSAGQRYDIINIEDPAQPYRVGRFELDAPGRRIHDVWVADGIAYSSNWTDGVVMVDVGNGVAGGSPSNPVMIGSYAYPSGWNHAAFPYHDKETGKFYIIAGDEKFPNGISHEKPMEAAGWIHFIDFTDPHNPEEVARYQVPEAGTHNFWVEGDTLYVAYYNGGVRVVDISGDLKGDLYRQGREIAKYIPADPNGVVPNAPFTWGPQPHKGHLFFSDWNSGLWVTRLKPKDKPQPQPGL